jgi:site-specific recombinase XerD
LGEKKTSKGGRHDPESLTSGFDEADGAVVCAEPRRRVLENVVRKLSVMEISGKEDIEEYIRHQYRSYCRPNTIRNSYNALAAFGRFMKRLGKNDIKKVNKRDLEAFVEHEQDRGTKLSTVKTRVAVLKAFLRFLLERGVIGEDVFPWKLRIKMPETLPRCMDPEDVDRLLAVEGGVRDRAMLLVLLRTGMRIGELLSTRVRDLHLEEQKILIFEAEKNQRGRVVYFSIDAKDALEAWLDKRNKAQPFLFYGRRGRPLTYPAARMVFMKYMDKAGLSHKGYTLHCLRHTYATDLLNAGMPLECLEKLLGHRSLEVTRRYARLTDKSREEAYFKAMAIIERSQRDGYQQRDRELQTLLEETQLFSSHDQELPEHP